jgi:cellulose biosynthesis protein BcsQ
VIVTFYSFKGGVGRSMALANVAARLCRSGLRTLMIDFDLEAPGLERFFPIDHAGVRGNPGLLDLLTSYKQCMAQPVGRDAGEFKNLGRFIVPVYHTLPSGGSLDLLPAGQRGNEDQLSNYAYLLRTFDWQEFFFEWAGELFFRWLTRELEQRYDLVLVDSRTGVTEMGGICAYQLADSVVMFCASNSQNVQGTRDVIQNFNSERVRALRKERPLQVIVAPARVQRESPELAHFRSEFAPFEQYLPAALKEKGLSFWDLMIPYNPAYAFDERIVTESKGDGDADFRRAFERLALAVVLTANPGSAAGRLAGPLWADVRLEMSASKFPMEPARVVPPPPGEFTRMFGQPAQVNVEPEYDPTTPSAGYDAFLSYNQQDKDEAEQLIRVLEDRGKKVFVYFRDIPAGSEWAESIERALRRCPALIVLIGSQVGNFQSDEIAFALERSAANKDYRIMPVLLPGSSPDSVPLSLRRYQWVDLRSGFNTEANDAIVEALTFTKKRTVELSQVNPYPGMRSLEEADAPFFFGRKALVGKALEHLEAHRFLAVVGAPGSGKSGLLRAGIIPALRERWKERGAIQVYASHPGADPIRALAASLSGGDSERTGKLYRDLTAAGSIEEVLKSAAPTAIVVDQLEELWMAGNVPDRVQYLKLLVSVEHEVTGWISVIVSLRSDFYSSAMEQPEFADVLSRNQLPVSPMTPEELREAIELPARGTGVSFEPGLVDRILQDLAHSSTPLPLLQMLLTKLWQDRRRGFITHESYERLGGLQVLSRTAEEVYGGLSPDERAAAKRVFLRLVSPAGGRLSVPQQVFSEQERAVIQTFVGASLLMVDSSSGSASLVRLSHDAISREWERLRGWIKDNAKRLQARDELKAAEEQWQANRENRDYLYRGAALTQAQRLVRENADLFSAELVEFVRAGTRAMWRRNGIIASTALAVMVLAGLGVQYYFQARIGRLLGWLSDASAVSLRMVSNRAFVLDAGGAGRLVNLLSGSTLAEFPGVTAAILSPDGRTGAAASRSGSVTVLDASSGKQRGQFGTAGRVTSLAISPDNQRLATGGADGAIRVWDIRNGQLLATANARLGAIQNLAFQKDGKAIVASGASGRLTVDAATGKMTGSLTQ